ncbi:hypothetical protein GBA52_025331 [Prunus armeniaca]|nr:hypothetical protein GBA52_025331 [Prunus armeniaca]
MVEQDQQLSAVIRVLRESLLQEHVHLPITLGVLSSACLQAKVKQVVFGVKVHAQGVIACEGQKEDIN